MFGRTCPSTNGCVGTFHGMVADTLYIGKKLLQSVNLWLMWKWRNNDVFNGTEESLARKFQLIQHYTSEFLAGFSTQGTAVARRRMPGTVWVGWTTPQDG